MTKPIDQELEDFCAKSYSEIPWQFVGNMSFLNCHSNGVKAGAKFERERMAKVLEMVESVIYNVHSEFCWHEDRDELPAWAKDLMNGTSEALEKLREVRK